MDEHDCSYPLYAKIIHLGVAAFGIGAYLTGESAEDGNLSTGYWLHAYLGLSLAAFIVTRIVMGLTKSETLSFKGWLPIAPLQWKRALEDFRSLLRFSVPQRNRHEGLAGLTQAFGLALFTWMALTGAVLFVLGQDVETEIVEIFEELHKVGESLIPLYLVMHIGAVLLHALGGNPIWKKMFSIRPE